MNPFDNFFNSFYPKIRVKALLNDIRVIITASDLGLFGIPRKGQPKTTAERLASHQSRYGTTQLPPRGTGLTR